MDPTPSIPGREQQRLFSQELREADAGAAAGSYAEYLRQERTGPPMLPEGARCKDCMRQSRCRACIENQHPCMVNQHERAADQQQRADNQHPCAADQRQCAFTPSQFLRYQQLAITTPRTP